MRAKFVPWIATSLSIGGAPFVIAKSVVGQWLWSFGALCWLYLALRKKDWPQVALWSVYLLLDIIAIVAWMHN